MKYRAWQRTLVRTMVVALAVATLGCDDSSNSDVSDAGLADTGWDLPDAEADAALDGSDSSAHDAASGGDIALDANLDPNLDHCILDRDRNGDGRFNVRYTRGYDERGLMREQTRDDNLTGTIDWRADFEYDHADRLIDEFYVEIGHHADRRYLYTYDEADRLSRLRREDNGRRVLDLNYVYDDLGRLSVIYHEGNFESVTRLSYEDDGRTVIEEFDEYDDGEIDERDVYRYDAQGKLLNHEREHIDGSVHQKSAYTYDAQGRMHTLRVDDLVGEELLDSWEMVYDPHGYGVQGIKFFGKSLINERPASGLLSLLFHAQGYPRLLELDWFIDGKVNERIRYTGGALCKLEDEELRQMVRNARWIERN
ncbi:MAG: hypothetical protein H0U74_17435 [Bradymonadaceae bacterium]|nr:hypothetical protein [Lujinxingiaceae bacterium]